MHAMAQPDPLEKFGHIGAIVMFGFALYPQWQCDIFKCREMIEQTEFLKDKPNLAAQLGQFVMIKAGCVLAELLDQPTIGFQGQEHQLQKGCFACT